ncbi:anthranilate phosphoribosyltransferase [Bacillus altitudinis]|uniref:anthranilate phosphoribosyltransferase n=1 Tax=Bacillus TaxID=1386 RepID=UPI002102F1B9|nr:anthranilate phosphoribosyltransferase [Bacillus sp. FS02]
MNQRLSALVNGGKLSEKEANGLMHDMMSGSLTDAEVAASLSILAHRGETAEEMTGFVKAIRQHAAPVERSLDVVDTCGTGGDGLSTFNISTAAAIVASAAGAKIAKHGNRSVSSKSGSADVLECLGIQIQSTPEETRRQIQQKNMGFLFAPLYHSSMKQVAAVRKQLGFRTVFNLLGPLCHPMQAKKQIIGVYAKEKAKLMAKALARLEPEHVLFVCGDDGLDELTITANSYIIELKKGVMTEYTLNPEDFGLEKGHLSDIQVQSPEESAKLIQNILNYQAGGAPLHITALNAGAALYVAGKAESLMAGTMKALETIKNGSAKEQLARLKQKTKEEEIYA